MSEFDPLHDKAYTQRLTQLGEKRSIVASEDIYNEQGVLLVKKGSAINEKIADKIVRFKLIKPIESSVDIENSVDAIAMLRDIEDILHAYPQINELHSKYKLDSQLKVLCSLYARHPILRQKVTVMRDQMPKLYRQSLGITWLSVLISCQMKLSAKQTETCFLAGLAHDFGMMHIDPDIVSKQEALTAAEWRQIQAHTIIARKLIDNVPGIDKAVAVAVSEHHERCDGSGYPFGRFSNQLSIEGQVIALAESAIAVFINKLLPNGKNLRDLLPVLQVNSESHFYDTYKALMLILRTAKLDETATTTDSTIDNTINHVVIKNDQLNHLLAALESVISNFKDSAEHRLLLSAKSVLTQIIRIVRGSGILDSGYLRWLQQVKQEKLAFNYREVEDVSLMLDEIEWHLMRTKKMLDTYIEQGPEKEKTLRDTMRKTLLQVPVAEGSPERDYTID